jgi:precorrin-6B C5,15-methyltransferase / cobalt-precorrin-6B C5,C15-methyltransferase
VRCAVTVVGLGADGCAGLSARAASAVAAATVLVGGERHLAFFPQFRGERIVIDRQLSQALDRVALLADEEPVCVLASGDPLFFGIGARVAERVGAEHVEFIPHPSSIQWAFARAGLPWEDAAFLSLHGRGRAGLVARLRERRKVACLTDRQNTPAAVARHLLAHGETAWQAWVCERLGGPGERVRSLALGALATCEDVDPLNVLLLVRSDPAWRPPSALPFLADDAFEQRSPRRGLITKREVRCLSLAALRLRRDCVVWDVGAGSGSVGIEAALVATEGRVYAVERDPEAAARCRRNACAHGADNLVVVSGTAPEALAALEAPDAVFVGGSGGHLDAILAACAGRLRRGGWIVVNAVTLETLAEARRAYSDAGLACEVALVSVSRGVPLAGRTRLDPLSPVYVLSARAGGAP